MKRKFNKWLIGKPLLYVLLAVGIFCEIEILNHQGFSGFFEFIKSHPLIALYNVLMILDTLSISEIFARRTACLISITILWLAMGMANALIIADRVQPFTYMDLMLIVDSITIMPKYFTWFEIVLVFAGVFALLAGIILMFAKLKKREKPKRVFAVIVSLALIFGTVCVHVIGVGNGTLTGDYDNLVASYKDYGFTYCFFNTIGTPGLAQPADYSEKAVETIVDGIDEGGEIDVAEEPNVIFVQLESFIDANALIGARYSENPCPNFSKLLATCPSGYLTVPTVGGGTANTEFEILTGLSRNFFTEGEYPYNTALAEGPCESICYSLSDFGYTSTAIHNYTGTYYDRDSVYSNLGFNVFVPLEYMSDVTYNRIGWAHDEVLTGEILKALRATAGQDFIFTVTVETHGKFSDTVYEDDEIQVNTAPSSMNKAILQNYVNGIHSSDKFVGELVDALENYREPVIVVFYGDHLPAIGLSESVMFSGSMYETKYVIWNNYGAHFDSGDLTSYQLSSRVLSDLGLEGGVVSRLHQSAGSMSQEAYLEQLEILEYDILYGEKTVYGGVTPYEPTTLKMGSRDITVSSAQVGYGRILVKGGDFTESSVINVDGDDLTTLYIDKNTLAAEYAGEGGTVTVSQVADNGKVMSTSAPFVMGEE